MNKRIEKKIAKSSVIKYKGYIIVRINHRYVCLIFDSTRYIVAYGTTKNRITKKDARQIVENYIQFNKKRDEQNERIYSEGDE